MANTKREMNTSAARNRHKLKNQQPPAGVLRKLQQQHQQQHRRAAVPPPRRFTAVHAAFLFLASVAFGYFGFSYVVPYGRSPDAETFRPFDGSDTFPLDPVLPGEYGPELWSTLLPGHYFGLRATAPNSTMASIMWFRQDLQRGLAIRHFCRHEDQLASYYWTHHDLRSFGHQRLIDQRLQLNTSFLRLPGGPLMSRIRMEAPESDRAIYSLILYAAAEHPDELLHVADPVPEGARFAIRVERAGKPPRMLTIRLHTGQVLVQSFLATNSTPDRLEHTVRQHLFLYNGSLVVMANPAGPDVDGGNFIAVQLAFRHRLHVDMEMQIGPEPVSLTESFDFELELAAKQRAFEADLDAKLGLSPELPQPRRQFARTVLSNMIGSIGYYYGQALVDTERDRTPRRYGPVQLLAAAPSRPHFPRGFLWDEGFHLLLLGRYDPPLAMAIIRSWLGLMNQHGWIPREVILGAEAESRVPAEFLVQHSSNANPPSMLLAVEWLVDSGRYQRDWLEAVYPRLQRWFQWLNATQAGPSRWPHSYRWRGRNASAGQIELNPKTLASGLDDYPRASHPTDEEIHLDLFCWMALAARLMAKIGSALGRDEDARRYQEHHAVLADPALLTRLHWSEPDGQFCDRGLHSTDVRLERLPGGDGDERTGGMHRRVLVPPQYRCVAEFGYVSLFPLLMTLLAPDNPQLGATLDRLADPAQLWTPYGLRSLSKTSAYYRAYNTEHDPPYWRGPVWINLNYLVVRALRHYGAEPGPYQARAVQLHRQLSERLVNAVAAEFNRTGHIWEQYDDQTGAGRGAHPFTGWSALVVLVLADQ